ncbi:MAG: hypothetical protein R3E32_05715 [Chitinophagales bacterium]
MASTGFHTEIAKPDKVESTSGLFKVILPSFLVVVLLSFIPAYYKMNMLDTPVLFSSSFIFLLLLLIPFLFFYNWYHKNYEEVGELNLTSDAIEFELEGVDRKWHCPITEVKDLTVIYDGYGGLLSPKKGDGNVISFVADGEAYELNFVLPSQEDAEKMGDVLKQWYAKGIHMEERSTSGDERYLMLYGPQFKPAMA